MSTEEQKEFIEMNYKHMTNAMLATRLRLKLHEVYDLMKDMNLERKKKNRPMVVPAIEQESEFFEHDPNLATI